MPPREPCLGQPIVEPDAGGSGRRRLLRHVGDHGSGVRHRRVPAAQAFFDLAGAEGPVERRGRWPSWNRPAPRGWAEHSSHSRFGVDHRRCIGSASGVAHHSVRQTCGAVTPFAVAINATPIVALAPIFNAWFGLTDPASNQAVVVVVVFFPVFINTTKGLTQVHADQLELMRSFGASEFTVLRRVRIPNAMPFFLTSLRIAAPLSVIAAIVAEYFGGPQSRLGPVITQNASFARYDVAWAAIVVASGIGLALFLLAVLAERIAMPWKRPETISSS